MPREKLPDVAIEPLLTMAMSPPLPPGATSARPAPANDLATIPSAYKPNRLEQADRPHRSLGLILTGTEKLALRIRGRFTSTRV
jgi:hypothetical protein